MKSPYQFNAVITFAGTNQDGTVEEGVVDSGVGNDVRGDRN